MNISDKKDWIEFIIEDNGEGIQGKDNTVKKHQSMAMIIFAKRRKLIQQKYNKDFKFEIQNLKNLNQGRTGVRIVINIPIIE